MKSEVCWEPDHRAFSIGHCKDFGFHSSDESLGNFKQKRDMILLALKKMTLAPVWKVSFKRQEVEKPGKKLWL